MDQELKALVDTLPEAKEIKTIPGLGSTAVAIFFFEVCDITNNSYPQQLVNLEGLSLLEHSSGKFKGQQGFQKED